MPFIILKYYFILHIIFASMVNGHGQKIVNGFYINNMNDTVACLMPKYKGFKEETNTYRQIEIIDKTGASRILYPNEIYGYVKDGVVYKSVILFNKNVFIKSLVQGKAMLYYYSDEEANGYYIFKRDNEKNFMVMDYTFHFSKIIGPNPGMNERSSSAAFDIKARDNTFIIFFSEYFKDYEPVVRKIKAEFYTKDDMIDVFENYNSFSDDSKTVKQNVK